MPGHRCISFIRLLTLGLLLPWLTQCGLLKFQSKNDRAAPAAETGAADASDDNEDAKADEDAQPAKVEEGEEKKPDGKTYRVIAVDQTPFFRWLRSGLKSSATPARFLDKGTQVEVLKEDAEAKFTQVRIEGGKKGWVPSRLVKESNAGEVAAATETALPVGDEATPATQPSLPPAGPAQLPDSPDALQPALKSDEIGEPLHPSYKITTPRRQPKPAADVAPPTVKAPPVIEAPEAVESTNIPVEQD